MNWVKINIKMINTDTICKPIMKAYFFKIKLAFIICNN